MKINEDLIKNVINIDNFENTTSKLNIVNSRNLYNFANDSLGYIISPNGAITATAGYRVSEWIKVQPNTQYTISWDYNSDNAEGEDMMRIGYFTSAKAFISRPNSSTHPWTITTPSNCYYVRISYNYYSGQRPVNTNVVFQLGTTTSYNIGYIPSVLLNSRNLAYTNSINGVYIHSYGTGSYVGLIAFEPLRLDAVQRSPILIIGTQNGYADKIQAAIVILNKDSYTPVQLGNRNISFYQAKDGTLQWYSNNYSTWIVMSTAQFNIVPYGTV